MTIIRANPKPASCLQYWFLIGRRRQRDNSNSLCANSVQQSNFSSRPVTRTLFSHLQERISAAMAPKAEKKPAKKVAKTAKTAGKKKSKAKVESFKIYIYKVLKQVSVSLSPVSILL
jgi:alpha-D-ribose 1-methylphosphonate 5-triphosphate synthase subunit PhnG